MKAITLTQPWATLVAIGAKKIETRSWSTNYRGRLAIHAAKGLASVGGKFGFLEIQKRKPFRSVLEAAGYYHFSGFPFGAIIATVNVVDVIEMDNALIDSVPRQELLFGEYELGRYAWLLEDVEMLKELILCKGALGLWEWGKE